MADKDDRIDQLRNRLEALIRRHGEIAVEMYDIQRELGSLTAEPAMPAPEPVTEPPKPATEPPLEPSVPERPLEPVVSAPLESYKTERSPHSGVRIPENIERWVGENLISKIGIAITILGVAIGAKYAIDRGWITPVMRIVFGYLVGIVLLFFALRFREKYERFSAVLLAGAMAIFYFISFAAYDFYALVPQAVAFGLMTGITVFTVIAALKYDRVLIGHIGLIGAYAVPFLLSQGRGQYAFLFSYVALVNVGILAVSVARYWRSLFYPSFIITWAIFGLWYANLYDPGAHLTLGIGFATAFFAIFYATFITYKLIGGLQFKAENVLLILANAFVFYGFVYGMADSSPSLSPYLGPITLANAAIHLGVAVTVYRFASADRTVVSLLAALVITFVTISIPVQMDGNWVTLVWIAEAAVLFVIARAKDIPLYEWFSYPLVFLAMASLFDDWMDAPAIEALRPILNTEFLTAVIFAGCLGLILWVDSIPGTGSKLPNVIFAAAKIYVSALLVLVVYNAFRIEISNYWRQEVFSTEALTGGYARDLYPPLMNFVWQLNYSMAFTALIWALNERIFRNRILKSAAAVFAFCWILLFLTGGLAALAELRDAYLHLDPAVPSHGAGGMVVRYAVYAFAAPLMFILYSTFRDVSIVAEDQSPRTRAIFDVFLHFVILCVLTAELFTWMEFAGISDSGKLALSILWGVYAVAVLLLGIAFSKKHLRVASIVLFGITLLKVFIYDLADLDTVSRTVVFVSLGALLLVASYLYTKYGEAIFGKGEA